MTKTHYLKFLDFSWCGRIVKKGTLIEEKVTCKNCLKILSDKEKLNKKIKELHEYFFRKTYRRGWLGVYSCRKPGYDPLGICQTKNQNKR